MEDTATARRQVGSAGMRALAFLLLCGVALALLYRLGLPHYHAPERARIQAMMQSPDHVEAVVWGSSHAQAIHLRSMGKRGKNLYTTAQDLFETSQCARALVPHLPQLEEAYLSVSYFSFFHDNGRYERDGVHPRAEVRIRGYARYPFTWDYLPGDRTNFIKGLLHPIITPDHWEQVFEDPWAEVPIAEAPSRGPDLEPLDIGEERRKNLSATSEKPHEEHQRYARQRCSVHREVIPAMQEDSPDVTSRATASTIALARFLQDRGVRPVFFTPPYYKAYNESCDERWREVMLEQMQQVVDATEVEYYDFSHDPELTAAPKNFVNADHLNGRGRRLFSLRLLEEMRAHPTARPGIETPRTPNSQ